MADKRKLQGKKCYWLDIMVATESCMCHVEFDGTKLTILFRTGEIERCLKKVSEGVETFEDIWQKVCGKVVFGIYAFLVNYSTVMLFDFNRTVLMVEESIEFLIVCRIL